MIERVGKRPQIKNRRNPPSPAIVAIFPGADDLPAFYQSIEMPPHHEGNPQQYKTALSFGATNRGDESKTEAGHGGAGCDHGEL